MTIQQRIARLERQFERAPAGGPETLADKLQGDLAAAVQRIATLEETLRLPVATAVRGLERDLSRLQKGTLLDAAGAGELMRSMEELADHLGSLDEALRHHLARCRTQDEKPRMTWVPCPEMVK